VWALNMEGPLTRMDDSIDPVSDRRERIESDNAGSI
jgi:hypothetical protein